MEPAKRKEIASRIHRDYGISVPMEDPVWFLVDILFESQNLYQEMAEERKAERETVNLLAARVEEMLQMVSAAIKKSDDARHDAVVLAERLIVSQKDIDAKAIEWVVMMEKAQSTLRSSIMDAIAMVDVPELSRQIEDQIGRAITQVNMKKFEGTFSQMLVVLEQSAKQVQESGERAASIAAVAVEALEGTLPEQPTKHTPWGWYTGIALCAMGAGVCIGLFLIH